MRQRTIAVDLDNTIVDAACRKHTLLKEIMPDVSLDDVKANFLLIKQLGDGEANRTFFNRLDTPETIAAHTAPPFTGAVEALRSLIAKEYRITIVTGRPESVREATRAELDILGLPTSDENLLMAADGDKFDRKFERIRQLHAHQSVDLVAVVGDRPEDVEAAQALGVPAILFASTTSPEEQEILKARDGAGFRVCQSWSEIATAIEDFTAGTGEMAALRKLFIDQYSDWLTDLDNKARLCVTVAGALSALSGKLFLDDLRALHETPPTWLANVQTGVVGIALCLSIGALLYAIQAFTSRVTSGPDAGKEVSTTWRHWLAVLVGRPTKWHVIPGDAIQQHADLMKASDADKSRAHLTFFYDRYKTHDPSALENLRLFELRATNYLKTYPERLSSKLLRLAVLLLLLWMAVAAVRAITESPSNLLDLNPNSPKASAVRTQNTRPLATDQDQEEMSPD